jgi:iron complex outermembrane recepter protein
LIGSRPVDVPARKIIASVDWRPPGSATSIDVAVEHVGPNTGDALNRVRVEPYTTVGVGVRLPFQARQGERGAEMQATNLFNIYGWEVAGNNAFIYTQSRQIVGRIAVDFRAGAVGLQWYDPIVDRTQASGAG